jgi:hypothetical protein
MLEVLKQCLSMLEHASTISAKDWKVQSTTLIADIKQAIAELESQEPVAYCEIHHLPEPCAQCAKEHEGYNTHPPQRTWVGLTDEDLPDYENNYCCVNSDFIAGARWADATLHEKNSFAEEKNT